MGLDVWFPLAIYFEDLAEGADQNPRLLARIHQLAEEAGVAVDNPTASWTGDVHNVDRLHLDPAFDWLTGQVGLHALRYLKSLGHDLAKTDIYVQRSWPVITRREQRVARHAHHTAHLSAVYYVATPNAGAPGQLRFYNDARQNELSPGIGNDMTQGYAQYNALNFGSAVYEPTAGRLIVFPAKQTHAVDPNETDEDRVSVAYDIVLTSRGGPEDGRHEFLMPAPSLWRRLPRSEPEMQRGEPAAPAMASTRLSLAECVRNPRSCDGFSLPPCDGHPLWTPVVFRDCASPAARRDYARRLADASDPWLADSSGAIALRRDCADWPACRDAIARACVHLSDRDIPLDRASAAAPVLEKRNASQDTAFERGRAPLSLYLRLDDGDGDCRLEFAEGGGASLAPGALLMVGGARRRRLVGASLLMRIDLDAPAIARSDALDLAHLRANDLPDAVAFAAIAAQPIGLATPTVSDIQEKLALIERRRRIRTRQETCPAVRRFLFEQADPATASAGEIALIRAHGSGDNRESRALTIDSTLDAEECALLRRYAEAHMTSIVPDSVDGQPEYQVNLTEQGLRDLLGTARVDAMLDLPCAVGARRDAAYRRIDIFLRKYAPLARPSLTFHSDLCAYTVNISLTEDRSFRGGRLLALCDGELKHIPRREGTAVMHRGDLVHGVSRIETGERYALILFFYEAEGNERPPVAEAATISSARV